MHSLKNYYINFFVIIHTIKSQHNAFMLFLSKILFVHVTSLNYFHSFLDSYFLMFENFPFR